MKYNLAANSSSNMNTNLVKWGTAIILSVVMTSCVSIKTPSRPDLVPVQAPVKIGNYPVRIERSVNLNDKETIVTTVIWHYFNNADSKDTALLGQATHIELQLLDNKSLRATLHQNDVVLREVTLKGKLKNGYFRTKHDFKLKGIPPFYWTTTSSKTQFGLGSEGQLYIDTAGETNGSILIIMAGTPGFTQSITVWAY